MSKQFLKIVHTTRKFILFFLLKTNCSIIIGLFREQQIVIFHQSDITNGTENRIFAETQKRKKWQDIMSSPIVMAVVSWWKGNKTLKVNDPTPTQRVMRRDQTFEGKGWRDVWEGGTIKRGLLSRKWWSWFLWGFSRWVISTYYNLVCMWDHLRWHKILLCCLLSEHRLTFAIKIIGRTKNI